MYDSTRVYIFNAMVDTNLLPDYVISKDIQYQLTARNDGGTEFGVHNFKEIAAFIREKIIPTLKD